MTHETWREKLALGAYGELEAGERADLDAHLAACAECRAFGEELAAGLGRVALRAPDRAVEEAWLADLRAGLEPTLRRRRRPGLGGFALGAATGLAAGLLLAFAWSSVGRPAATSGGSTVLASAFERATPPPQARSGGAWSQLGRYLRR